MSLSTGFWIAPLTSRGGEGRLFQIEIKISTFRSSHLKGIRGVELGSVQMKSCVKSEQVFNLSTHTWLVAARWVCADVGFGRCSKGVWSNERFTLLTLQCCDNSGNSLLKVASSLWVRSHRDILLFGLIWILSLSFFFFDAAAQFFCLWQQVAIYVLPTLLPSFSPLQMALVLTDELRQLAL